MSSLYTAVGDLCVWTTSGHLRVIYLTFSDKTPLGITRVPLAGEVIWSDFSLTYGKKCALNLLNFVGDASSGLDYEVFDLPYKDGVQGTEVEFVESPVTTGQFENDVTADSHRLRIYGNFDISSVFADVVQLGKY